MKQSTRILITLIILEILILGGGWWLANASLDWEPSSGHTRAGNAIYIFEMTGMVAGGIGGVMLVMFIAQWFKERREK